MQKSNKASLKSVENAEAFYKLFTQSYSGLVGSLELLFGFHDAKVLENVGRFFGEPAGVDLLRPNLVALELLSQLQHGLLSVGDELLQILIAQLLTGAAFSSRLS